MSETRTQPRRAMQGTPLRVVQRTPQRVVLLEARRGAAPESLSHAVAAWSGHEGWDPAGLAPRETQSRAGWILAWDGPGRWLLVSTMPASVLPPVPAPESLAIAVDMTDAWVVFEVTGACAVDHLRRGIDLDLLPASDGTCGRIQRSRLAEVPVWILNLAQRDTPAQEHESRYWVFVARSYAPWLGQWLEPASTDTPALHEGAIS
ncbi:MAG: hypothetical protein AB7E55_13960 [Pigmentiphaga sp.]